MVKGEIALADASVEIDLRHETENPWWLMTDSYSFPYSLYLAVGDGRIGVATVSLYDRLASCFCGANHQNAF